jgi:hypothetical protein
MRTRLYAGLSIIAVVIASIPVALAARAPVHASRITFLEPTRVCGFYLMGDYVVVHDDGKMAEGKPCTTFYRTRAGEAEAVVSFHCIPRQRSAVSQTTVTTMLAQGVSTATRTRVLLEYQLAGDKEAHGVPQTTW